MIARVCKNMWRKWLRSLSETHKATTPATLTSGNFAEKLETVLNSPEFWTRDVKDMIVATYDDVALTSSQLAEDCNLKECTGDLTLLWQRLGKLLVGVDITCDETKRLRIVWNEEGTSYTLSFALPPCLTPLLPPPIFVFANVVVNFPF